MISITDYKRKNILIVWWQVVLLYLQLEIDVRNITLRFLPGLVKIGMPAFMGNKTKENNLVQNC